jgi:hypothetical protein
VRGRVCLGFPGVGGTLISGAAEYMRIKPQPSALEAVHEPRLEVERAEAKLALRCPAGRERGGQGHGESPT